MYLIQSDSVDRATSKCCYCCIQDIIIHCLPTKKLPNIFNGVPSQKHCCWTLELGLCSGQVLSQCTTKVSQALYYCKSVKSGQSGTQMYMKLSETTLHVYDGSPVLLFVGLHNSSRWNWRNYHSAKCFHSHTLLPHLWRQVVYLSLKCPTGTSSILQLLSPLFKHKSISAKIANSVAQFTGLCFSTSMQKTELWLKNGAEHQERF